MNSATIAVFAVLLSGGAAQDQQVSCAPTDYTPDSIDLRTAPSPSATSFQSIPSSQITSLIRLDAAATPKQDWLKVGPGGADGGWVSARDVVCRVPSPTAEQIIAKEAGELIQLLKSEDMTGLAQSVHPVKGLRFSPYAKIDPESDVVLSAEQLVKAPHDPEKRKWGGDAGSGKPLRMTFAAYYKKFVYDRNFAAAEHIMYNHPDEGTNRAWEHYPNAIVADYSLPQPGTSRGEHLRLVFEEHKGRWYLSGIIHDGWTI